MTQRMSISLKTTASCQGACRHCVAKPWMALHKGEHTSLDDIEALVAWSRESGYHWKHIVLSGGEPLLWPHLLEASKMLQQSRISEEIAMQSNALAADPSAPGQFDRLARACEHIDRVRFSRYQGNSDIIDAIMARAKNGRINRAMIHTAENTVWCIPPAEPVPDSLPAVCSCQSYGLWKRTLTLCAPIEMLYDKHRWDKFRLPCVEVNRAGFLSDLERIDPTKQDACRFCVGNSKVAAVASRVRNRVR